MAERGEAHLHHVVAAELLATISLGNTAANAAIVALVLWPVLLGQWPVELTLPAVAIFILLGCEVLPKTLAIRAPESWSRRVAGPKLVLRETTGRGLEPQNVTSTRY